MKLWLATTEAAVLGVGIGLGGGWMWRMATTGGPSEAVAPAREPPGTTTTAPPPYAHIPPGSPIIIATLAPDERPRNAATRRAGFAFLEFLADELAPTGTGAGAADGLAEALGAELRRVVEARSVAALGFAESVHYALYLDDLLPVLRLRLADPGRLVKAIERIEERAGRALPSRPLPVGEVWWLGGNGPIALAFAVTGRDLVAAVVPSDASVEELTRRFAKRPPAGAARVRELLEGVSARYGGRRDGEIARIDTSRLVAALLDPPPAARALLRGLRESTGLADPRCGPAYHRLARAFPEIATVQGRSAANPEEWSVIVRVEEGIAAALQGLRGDLVDSAAAIDPATSVYLAVGIDPRGVPALLNAWLEIMGEEASACATVGALRRAVVRARVLLRAYSAHPAQDARGIAVRILTPPAALFHGRTADLRGVAVWSTRDPQGVLTALRDVAGDLVPAGLSDGGRAVALPSVAMATGASNPLVAWRGQRIGLSVGERSEGLLAKTLAAPGGHDGAILVAAWDMEVLRQVFAASIEHDRPWLRPAQVETYEALLAAAAHNVGREVIRVELGPDFIRLRSVDLRRPAPPTGPPPSARADEPRAGASKGGICARLWEECRRVERDPSRNLVMAALGGEFCGALGLRIALGRTGFDAEEEAACERVARHFSLGPSEAGDPRGR